MTNEVDLPFLLELIGPGVYYLAGQAGIALPIGRRTAALRGPK